MANYLVVEPGDIPVMHEVEAKNLARAVESLELEDGEKVIVYRVANRRKAIVRTETTRYIEVE